MHEAPDVPNWGKPGKGRRLAAGPDLRRGAHGLRRPGRHPPAGGRLDRGHRRRALAAHAEHTIAITDDGPEILTLP